MGLESKAGGSESRFAAYVEAITSALGHADRAAVPIVFAGAAAAGGSQERRASGRAFDQRGCITRCVFLGRVDRW